MTRFAFEVPGRLTGKGRPRVYGGRAVTPRETVNAEAWVRACAVQAGVRPLDGPVALDVVILRAVPASWSRKRRDEALRVEWCEARPDLDNVAKLIGDALNGIAYRDDAQVARLLCERRFVADGRERVLVLIRPAREAVE